MKRTEIIKKLNKEVYEFLISFRSEEYDDGRVDLSNGAFVNISTYKTKSREQLQFESHQKYIDIQYMIHGEEIISLAPIDRLQVSEPYNPDNDITFYFSDDTIGTDCLLKAGEFQIIYPQEGHMPGVVINEPIQVRKAVFKIPNQS